MQRAQGELDENSQHEYMFHPGMLSPYRGKVEYLLHSWRDIKHPCNANDKRKKKVEKKNTGKKNKIRIWQTVKTVG